MAAPAISPERVRALNRGRILDRDFVVYWMQAAQRAEANHALEFAVGQANALRKPLAVLFGLTDSYPEANERHYAFMLEGLKETQASLRDRGIPMVVRRGEPDAAVSELARRACLVVTDDGYVRIERKWRRRAAAAALPCALVQVDTNTIVPVPGRFGQRGVRGGHPAPQDPPAARRFLKPLARTRSARSRTGRLSNHGTSTTRTRPWPALTSTGSVARAGGFRGGASEAARRLRRFVRAGSRPTRKPATIRPSTGNPA
jgi:deoxyribodipyrimidine photo-lyase